MPHLTRDETVARALATVERRVEIPVALDRVRAVLGARTNEGLAALATAGRLTVAFHPDRLDERGMTTAAGLARHGQYLPQWETGASSGHRSALPGGARDRWEREQFGVDDGVPPAQRPVYGALDLLRHRHGGSPAFGSCFLVLRDDVRARVTFSLGDSHTGPTDVGTLAVPHAVVAGLAEQTASLGLLGQPLGVDDLLTALAGQDVPAPVRTLEPYVEVQVHGGVDLRWDVEAIVVDPCFAGTPSMEELRVAARRSGAPLEQHPGTVLTTDRSATSAALARLVGEDHALGDDLVPRLTALAGDDGVVTAARLGTLLAGRRPGPRRPDGDDESSLLQHVKRLWRVTYAAGEDARPTS